MTKKVTKQWLADFETVADFYRLKDIPGELQRFKDDVKARMGDMGPWIEREAFWIRNGAKA